MTTKTPLRIILQGDDITETKTSEETSQGNTFRESVTITQCTWKMEVRGLAEDFEQGFSIKKEGNLFVLILF
jgi:hypothetical protein